MKIYNLKFKIKPRFYLFSAFLIFAVGFIWYSQIAAQSPNTPSPHVLAADTTSDAYTLIEEKNTSKNPLAEYDPVTISHTVKEGETVQSIAEVYHADAQTIVDYPYNKIGEDLQVSVGQILIIPNGYIDSPPPEIPIAVGSGLFSWPTKGVISQHAFWWHPGAIDIAASIGAPITSAYPGKVITVEKWSTGYGWHVVVEHSGGYRTLYGHMSRIDVKVGQAVQRGTRLGLVGSTGRSTGPHLHFEVHKGESAIDPMTLLPSGQALLPSR